MNAPRLDRDTVRSALSPRSVLDHFGIDARRSGDELRTHSCPECGERTTPAVVMNAITGLWNDFAHGCRGDLWDAIAGYADLDAGRDFRAVLELGAEIAGVAPDALPVDHTLRRAAIQQRSVALVAQRREEREVAIAQATPEWSRLAPRSEFGERYLEERGVLAALPSCRFTAAGEVALALHTADGRIVNVVRRRAPGAEPKVLGMKACPTAGTFIDALPLIVAGRDVVLVEGLFDSLTARIAWPDAVVLGAHGAGNIERIARAAAPRVKLAGTRLVLVPHSDEAGATAMAAAGLAAHAAGLRLRGGTLVVVDCGAKDLNDAWRAGWRP
jgi:hypothetical protein